MSLIQSARAISHALMQNHYGAITDEVLWTVIEKVGVINVVQGESFDKQELFEILKADISIGRGELTMLSEDVEPWLYSEKANINFDLWNRNKLYMKEKDPSFPISDLDDFTDKILDKCVNPKKEGSWDRRGMVVGHVQSGKTSNYVGLINKATDAGYKVIIIIAGTISSLRRQTQERIDSGYIGRNSSAFIREHQNRLIGVGKYNSNTDIYSLTSSYYDNGDEGDFNQKIASRLNIPIGKNPVVFVIKKNKSILENLIDWFAKDVNINVVDGTPKLFNVPALVIDDEADSASVNASRNINDIKTINRLIRTLLNIFNQNTFIGYTATPYANLFISQEHNDELTTEIKQNQYKIGEDLFPKDFIINIKAPSNYVGAAKIFGYGNYHSDTSKEPLDIFRAIDDFDPPFFQTINKENKDNLPDYLPKSLEYAIKTFVLTCAIRRVRGQASKHNSMLVHVALLVRWIDRVAYLVNETTKRIQDAIQSEDSDLMNELKEIYQTDFLPTTRNVLENLDYRDNKISEHDWDDISSELKAAALKIDVRSVHGTRSTTNLEFHKIEEIDYDRYENGLSVIAVGGSRLSRGITLEGLSVSYYLRTTKMYDSLMQMGRWFGYRPGYVDLCRIFTTNQIFEWFNHITMATEEMRNDFDEMTSRHLRPKDFRLKVRNHHGLLTITSLNKLHFSKEIEISFSGENIQTYCLLKSKNAIENNFNALKSLINNIGFPTQTNRIEYKGKIRHLFFPNTSIEAICGFIDSYIIVQPSICNATLSDYIKTQSQEKKISEWSICIVGNTDNEVFIDKDGNANSKDRIAKDKVKTYNLEYNGEIITLGCSVRNQRATSRGSEFYMISKNQIDQTSDRYIDLNSNLNYAKMKYSEIKTQRNSESKGLMIIYSLDERGTPNVNNEIPIIGYSLHFPKIIDETKVTYTTSVNRDFELERMEDDDNPENDA